MSRLISAKYREVQQQYLDRFTQLKQNEEELNRIFIDIYGLQGELTPEVAEKDVTVYRIIDQPNEEQRKMAYVLSMREEIVSLISYMVGCMLAARGMKRRSAPASPRGPKAAFFTMSRWGCSCRTRTASCPSRTMNTCPTTS